MKKPARKVEPKGSELQKLFGGNLRAAREQVGLTQADLADAAGTARQYLSSIENGGQNVTLAMAAALAYAVGRPLQQLLSAESNADDGTDNPPPPTSGYFPPSPESLALEFPAGQAFEVAVAAARITNRAVPLVNPLTRIIVGVVPKPETTGA